MKQSDFYPSYIPRKWIHLSHNKKRRIRKKYRHRIFKAIRQHDRDIETLAFIVRHGASHCGYTMEDAAAGASTMSKLLENYEAPAFSYDQDPTFEIPDDIQKLSEAWEALKDSILEVLEPVLEAITKVFNKISKWISDLWDRVLCNNLHWWAMAEHHKKHRIRKKYRNKIKRSARQKASELLRSLIEEDSQEEADDADDEEGP